MTQHPKLFMNLAKLGIAAAFALTTHAASAAPVKLMLNGPNTAPSDSAWVLDSNNTKQWVSPGCRADLESAGLTVSVTDWTEIGSYSDGAWMSCTQLVNALSTGGGSTGSSGGSSGGSGGGSVTLLLNGASPDGWVVSNDATKQWVSPSCRSQLTTAGITVVNSDWGTIGSYPTGPWQGCNAIQNLIGSGGGSGSSGSSGGSGSGLALLLNGSTSADGWVRLADNTKQYVDSNCRSQLEAGGITTIATDWSGITIYPTTTNWQSCTMLQNLVAGGGSSSGSGSGSGSGGSSGGGSGGGLGNYPPMPNFNANCLGINDGFSYSWDGGALAADAFKEARGPLLDDFNTRAATDGDQWPTGNQNTNFLIGEGQGHDLDKLNPWVLLPYSQTGSWASDPVWGSWVIQGAEFLGSVTRAGLKGYEFNLGPDTNVLKIFGGNLPGGGLNRWHLVPKSKARQYAQAMVNENMQYIFRNDTYASDLSFPLLHDQAKTQMEPFCRIRYMLGDNINSSEFSGRAVDRTKATHPTWNTPGGDGIPYEWEVWIANHLSVNVYHSDHVKSWDGWKAGDAYLQQHANYFANNLRGSVIREYANEIWNTAPGYYDQTVWVWNNGPYANNGDWQIMHHNYGKRTYDTGGVWEQAYSSRRGDLDLTSALQIAWPAGMVNRFVSPTGESFGDRIDSIGGTFYLGGPITIPSFHFDNILNGGIAAVDSNHRGDLANLQGNITELMDLTRQYTDTWHLYEGGSHMNFIGFDSGNAQHNQVWNSVESYWSSGTFTSLYNEFANWWRGINGSGELLWFHLYGIDNEVQPWGVYESTGDLTPIYPGVQNFIQNYNNF